MGYIFPNYYYFYFLKLILSFQFSRSPSSWSVFLFMKTSINCIYFSQDEQYGTDWLDRPAKIKREYLPFNATSIPPPSISDSGSFDANLGITCKCGFVLLFSLMLLLNQLDIHFRLFFSQRKDRKPLK